MTAEDVAAELRAARSDGRTVFIRGQGTRMPPPVDGDRLTILHTERLGAILAYEPDDLMVTVQAGCPRAKLEAALAERGQALPLQGAFGDGSVGGLLATAAEGVLALAHGGPRDRVTAVRAALADGSLVKGGARVVKSVAGLPIHRLMLGSMGTLGVILEASFKVGPKPDAEATVVVAFPGIAQAFEAARRVLASGFEPVFVNVLASEGDVRLAVGFDGFATRVASHMAACGDLVAPAHPLGMRILDDIEGRALRASLDDPGGGDPNPASVLRGFVRPTDLEAMAAQLLRSNASGAGDEAQPMSLDARPGIGSVYVTFTGTDEQATVRAVRAALGILRAHGTGVVHKAPSAILGQVDAWGEPPPDFPLMIRVKQALDPEGRFLPGRFVGGL